MQAASGVSGDTSASFRRWLARVRVASVLYGKPLTVRLLTLWGWVLALGFVVMMLVVQQTDAAELLGSVVVRFVRWLCRGVGLGLALVLAATASRQEQNLGTLLALHGVGARPSAWVRALAFIRRVALGLGGPTALVAVSAIVLSTSASLLLERLVLAALALLFVAITAAVLGTLSWWSAEVASRRAAGLLLLLVLGPHLLRLSWPDVPSVPAALDQLLVAMTRWGASLG